MTPHGDNAYDCEIYVKRLGMSPIDALRCATSSGAKFMRGSAGGDESNGPRVGELTPGAAADVIAVRGDATVDVRCLRDVAMVMSNGRVARLDDDLKDNVSSSLYAGGWVVSVFAPHTTAPRNLARASLRLFCAMTHAPYTFSLYLRHFQVSQL